MSRVTHHERCPRCKERGADRSRDNLAVYDDGHSYCFACGYYGHSPNSLSNMAKKLYKHKEQPLTEQRYADLSDGRFSSDLPVRVRLWLSSYGINQSEWMAHGFFWDMEKSLLVMPVLDNGRVVLVNCRYFGTNPDHPKYITKGYKNQHFKVIQPASESSLYVCVEDYLSAIKVGRFANCIPLFGAVAPRELILHLAAKRPLLRFWLDRDKAAEAAKQAARARQWIPDCATIITDLDPKGYSDDQIQSILNESLLHPTQSIS